MQFFLLKLFSGQVFLHSGEVSNLFFLAHTAVASIMASGGGAPPKAKVEAPRQAEPTNSTDTSAVGNDVLKAVTALLQQSQEVRLCKDCNLYYIS